MFEDLRRHKLESGRVFRQFTKRLSDCMYLNVMTATSAAFGHYPAAARRWPLLSDSCAAPSQAGHYPAPARRWPPLSDSCAAPSQAGHYPAWPRSSALICPRPTDVGKYRDCQCTAQPLNRDGADSRRRPADIGIRQLQIGSGFPAQHCSPYFEAAIGNFRADFAGEVVVCLCGLKCQQLYRRCS